MKTEQVQLIKQSVEEAMSAMQGFANRVVELTEANILASLLTTNRTEKDRKETLENVKATKKEEWAKAMKRANGDTTKALRYYCN